MSSTPTEKPERASRPISLDEYFAEHARAYQSEITSDVRSNATKLLTSVNRFLVKFGEYRTIVSGWRPAVVNASRVGATLRSRHVTGQAIDLADPDGDLDQFVLDNQRLLEACGLFVEHPSTTKGWCHLQSVPPVSGRRVFYP